METFTALLARYWRGSLRFSLICAWINGWVNNRKAGDLRRRRAHYDVTVMIGEIYRHPTTTNSTKPEVCAYSLGCNGKNIWRFLYQKQVSEAGRSNCIPQNIAGCNYLSLLVIPASSGNEVLICRHFGRHELTHSSYDLGSYSLAVVHQISNVMNISFAFIQILLESSLQGCLCTWHASCGVVSYAKTCCDIIAGNEITVKLIFFRIWSVTEKGSVE